MLSFYFEQLLFHFFTFLGVSFIEYLINEEQTLDLKTSIILNNVFF